MADNHSAFLVSRLRARLANMRRKPDDADLKAMCKGEKTEIVDGLLAFKSLLSAMYSDAAGLEGNDDDDRLKCLDESLALLYACAVFGNLKAGKSGNFIAVDKKTLLANYKKGGLPQKIRFMAHHGVKMGWCDSCGASVAQSKADIFSVAFPLNNHIIPAMKRFSDRIEAIYPIARSKPGTPATNFSGDFISGKIDLFAMADFAVAFGGASIASDSVDPLREEVLAMVDSHKSEWQHMVVKLLGECGLRCFGRNYLLGQWTISFHEKNKKPFLIFAIRFNEAHVQLTVPVHAAEQIIKQRTKFSSAICKGLEGFHCVQCPKECKGTNLVKIDGLTMCMGRAEGRRIYMGALDKDDFRSIEDMAELAFNSV